MDVPGAAHLAQRPSPGLFVSTLVLSLVCASRLRPASRAPLLFRPDTNIQVLLDLKYNLSAEGISCTTCSGEAPAGRALPAQRGLLPTRCGTGLCGTRRVTLASASVLRF